MPHTVQNQRFGVEIEVAGVSREEAVEAVRTALELPHRNVRGTKVHERDGRVWEVKSDSSIACVNGKEGAEVVSPILTYADLENVRRVARALREAGGVPHKSCAVHIHVDAANHDAGSLSRLAKLVWKHEDLIMDALGVLDSRRRQYCKPMAGTFVEQLVRHKPRNLDDLNVLWYGSLMRNPDHHHGSRYHGLNLHSVWYRKTVEFRYFNASLNAGKIAGYIQFCLVLSAKALNAKSASHERKPRIPGGDKFDFRVFLLGLGMIGDEFKTARQHLLSRLSGNASWRRYEGRRNES
jgi:hypothetical protein